MTEMQFKVIHFNNGMHGWGYSEEQYAKGLSPLISELEKDAPGAQLVWASTTPVRNDSTDGGATNGRIDARNEKAAEIMKTHHIPMDNQHALMLLHSDLYNGDVHYTKAGSALQANQVVESIDAILNGS
jgi:hypothetical protein